MCMKVKVRMPKMINKCGYQYVVYNDLCLQKYLTRNKIGQNGYI